MIAVFAFKKMKEHYKPFDQYFERLARLSVKAASKYYRTKLYADKDSVKYLNSIGLEFDQTVIVEEFIHDYENQYSIAKIYAMMKETEPYVVLDFDTILLEKIETTHTITYGHPELKIDTNFCNVDGMIYAHNMYVKPFNDHVRKYYTNMLDKFNWSLYPSFCLVVVKNPLIMSTVFETIFKTISKEDIERITPTLLEQFLSHQYLVKNNVDFGFLSYYHYFNDGEFDKEKILMNKYVHIHHHRENVKQEVEYLETIV